MLFMAVFDEVARDYDDWYLTKMGNLVDEVETGLAFELFSPERGMTVLDVGCGTGNFSLKLARKGCLVTGVDISRQMLGAAAEKAAAEGLDIDFQPMDVYELKFPDESFDAVFSMAAFEFIKDPERAMDQIFRVTKKSGRVMIGTINRDSSWGELYSSEECRNNNVFKYACFKTPGEMASLKKKNLVAVRQCLFIPPGAAGDEISPERERQLSASGRGGFICALWRK